jgi:hypothetical protein
MKISGAAREIRTPDPIITNVVLRLGDNFILCAIVS